MSHATGADVPPAIAEIQRAGWSVMRLADDLQVSTSAVYKWRNGTRTPNKVNFSALVELTEMEYAAENCRPGTRGVVLVHLQRAYELLETDADRARGDAKADEIANRQRVAAQRRKAEAAQRYAEIRQAVVAQRQAGRERIAAAVAAAEGRSVTYRVPDVFGVVDQDKDLAMVEAIF